MKEIIWLLEDGTERLSSDKWNMQDIKFLADTLKIRRMGFHKGNGFFGAGITDNFHEWNLIKGFKIKE